MSDKRLARILSAAAALALWQLAALAVGNEILLVSPIRVLLRLGKLIFEPDFVTTVAFSLLRIAAGFAAAFALSVLLAVLAGRFSAVEVFLRPYFAAVKTVPVASIIIISLVWLSVEQLSVFISFLMVLPILYSNLLQGIHSTDPALLEMAKCYRIPWLRRLGYIYIPGVKPYLLSGCSSALGLSWKAGIAAEVIGMVHGSIGEKLYDAKIYLLTSDLLAWTVVIVAVSVLFEKGMLLLLRAAFARWEKQ